MKSIEVRFLPGDRVRMGDVPGQVLAVNVPAPGHARFLVCWWDCGSRREEWLEDFELEPEPELQP